MEAKHLRRPWHVWKTGLSLLPWLWAVSLGPESCCGGSAGAIGGGEPESGAQSLRGAQSLPGLWSSIRAQVGSAGLRLFLLHGRLRAGPRHKDLSVPLCSSRVFLSGDGLEGHGRAGAPDFRPPLPSGRGWFSDQDLWDLARNWGGNAQTPKRARSPGSFLSSNPATRAQERAGALTQEPGTDSGRARRSGSGLGSLGDPDCVCSAPRSTAGIGCVGFFFFFLVRNKCSGVCKAPGSPEASKAPRVRAGVWVSWAMEALTPRLGEEAEVW